MIARLRQRLIGLAQRPKALLVLALKVLVVAVPLIYLIDAGRLDFSRLADVFSSLGNLAILLLLWSFSFVIFMAWRWKIVAEMLGLELPPGFAIKVHLAGMFLSNWLPSGIGGDLWKAYRFGVLLQHSGGRNRAYLSVLLDRLFGLYVLMLVGSVAVLLDTAIWFESRYSILAVVLLASWAAVTAIFCLLVGSKGPIPAPLKAMMGRLTARSKPARMVAENIGLLRKNLGKVLYCLVISILVQVLNVLFFSQIATIVTGETVAFSLIAGLLAIGLLVTIASMAPGGLGVGHLMFDALFAELGFEGGADVFNVFFFVLMFFSFAGLIPYLLPDRRQAAPGNPTQPDSGLEAGSDGGGSNRVDP